MLVSSNLVSRFMPVFFRASESHVNMASVPVLYRRYVLDARVLMLPVVQVDDEVRVGTLDIGHTGGLYRSCGAFVWTCCDGGGVGRPVDLN